MLQRVVESISRVTNNTFMIENNFVRQQQGYVQLKTREQSVFPGLALSNVRRLAHQVYETFTDIVIR